MNTTAIFIFIILLGFCFIQGAPIALGDNPGNGQPPPGGGATPGGGGAPPGGGGAPPGGGDGNDRRHFGRPKNKQHRSKAQARSGGQFIRSLIMGLLGMIFKDNRE